MKVLNRLVTVVASLALLLIWTSFAGAPEAAADHCSRG
jgi:hypothetical protein